MGLIRRVFGNDPMRREWRRTVESYRLPSQVRTGKSMEKPF